MKIEKGMAVNVEGMSDIVRQAVVKKFENIGFAKSLHFKLTDKLFFTAFIVGGLHSTWSTDMVDLKEITLSELMFCDQPDEITHCYYDTRENKLYYWRRLAYQSIKERELICAREPAKNKDWYEKGELPPVGEVVEGYVQDSSRQWKWLEVEVLKHSEPQHKECAVYVVKHGLLRWCDQFRPIKTEREKLAQQARDCIPDEAPIVGDWNTICWTIEKLIDAGWRPSND